MKNNTVEAKADTLEAARRKAWLEVPHGFFPAAEEVLARESGQSETIQASAETMEDACLEAQTKVPEGAAVVKRSVLLDPIHRTIPVRASSEEEGRSLAQKRLFQGERISSVRLAEPAKRGFLGIGARAPLFDVEVRRSAQVEITYKTLAHVRLRGVDADFGRTEREYRSPQYNVSLKHPTDWEILPENQDEAPWWKIVEIVGPQTSGARPDLLLRLSSISAHTDLDSYIMNTISDLRNMFTGLEVRTAEETHFLGRPAAWMRYIYQASEALMEELNVNIVFGTARTVILQMICKAPAARFDETLPIFAAMTVSLRIENGGLWLPKLIAVDDKQCARCGRDLQDSVDPTAVLDVDGSDLIVVCADCKNKSTPKPEKRCPKCGRPIKPGERTGEVIYADSGQQSGPVCSDCFFKSMFG